MPATSLPRDGHARRPRGSECGNPGSRRFAHCAAVRTLCASLWQAHSYSWSPVLLSPRPRRRARRDAEGSRARSPRPQALPGAALRRVPEPVDRRFQRPLAHDLRVIVRERLTAGDTDTQVLAFVEARYGEFVLLRPPFKPQTLLLWLTPLLLLGGRRASSCCARARASRRRTGIGALVRRRAEAPRRAARGRTGPIVRLRRCTRSTSATPRPWRAQAVRAFYWRTLRERFGWPGMLRLHRKPHRPWLPRARRRPFVGRRLGRRVPSVRSCSSFWLATSPTTATRLARFERMASPQARFVFTRQGFSITSDSGPATLSWASVREVWAFPGFWLFLLSRSSFLPSPPKASARTCWRLCAARPRVVKRRLSLPSRSVRTWRVPWASPPLRRQPFQQSLCRQPRHRQALRLLERLDGDAQRRAVGAVDRPGIELPLLQARLQFANLRRRAEDVACRNASSLAANAAALTPVLATVSDLKRRVTWPSCISTLDCT